MSEEDVILFSSLSLSSLKERIEEEEEKDVMRLKTLVTCLQTTSVFESATPGGCYVWHH